jgi:guanine deaminase
MTPAHRALLEEALRLARENVEGGGGPFGAVIAGEDGRIIARGANRVTAANDPTAHAEIVAIREACRARGTFRLDGCTLYASCEPCPMCLGAIYWARLDAVFYAATRDDAARAGFDDAFLYAELALPVAARRLPMTRLAVPGAGEAFDAWAAKSDRVSY